MIIVTSLSAKHSNKDNQHNAIKSWNGYGECYSMNNAHEISQLEPLYSGIKFIKTDRTVQQLIGKPLVSINAMIDYANDKGEDLLLINSDIVLTGLPDFKRDGITIFSRYDYTESYEDAKMFVYGFDAFFIPHEFLKTFPPSIYSLGCAWHDLATPYRAIINNIPVYYPSGRYAYHKLHPIQYNTNEWDYIAEYFKWEFKLDKRLSGGQAATMVMNIIKSSFNEYRYSDQVL
jgi:hypothetical protein